MKGRTSILNLLVYAFVIVAVGLIVINRMNSDIRILENTKNAINLTLLDKQQQKSEYTDEISRKDTEKYIVEIARQEYGYIYKGEIKYVITNPQLLYD